MATAEETLMRNIRKTIQRLRADQVHAMGMANLKQITPTTGLTCTPHEYHRLFPACARIVARGYKFKILKEKDEVRG